MVTSYVDTTGASHSDTVPHAAVDTRPFATGGGYSGGPVMPAGTKYHKFDTPLSTSYTVEFTATGLPEPAPSATQTVLGLDSGDPHVIVMNKELKASATQWGTEWRVHWHFDRDPAAVQPRSVSWKIERRPLRAGHTAGSVVTTTTQSRLDTALAIPTSDSVIVRVSATFLSNYHCAVGSNGTRNGDTTLVATVTLTPPKSLIASAAGATANAPATNVTAAAPAVPTQSGSQKMTAPEAQAPPTLATQTSGAVLATPNAPVSATKATLPLGVRLDAPISRDGCNAPSHAHERWEVEWMPLSGYAGNYRLTVSWTDSSGKLDSTVHTSKAFPIHQNSADGQQGAMFFVFNTPLNTTYAVAVSLPDAPPPTAVARLELLGLDPGDPREITLARELTPDRSKWKVSWQFDRVPAGWTYHPDWTVIKEKLVRGRAQSTPGNTGTTHAYGMASIVSPSTDSLEVKVSSRFPSRYGCGGDASDPKVGPQTEVTGHIDLLPPPSAVIAAVENGTATATPTVASTAQPVAGVTVTSPTPTAPRVGQKWYVTLGTGLRDEWTVTEINDQQVFFEDTKGANVTMDIQADGRTLNGAYQACSLTGTLGQGGAVLNTDPAVPSCVSALGATIHVRIQ